MTCQFKIIILKRKDMKHYLTIALLLCLVSLQGCSQKAKQSENQVQTQSQNDELIYHYPLGNTEVVLLSDGQNTGDPSVLVGASEEIVKEFVPTGTAGSAFNIFLLKLNGKNIIVDSGMGYHLVENLAKEGISPEQVDIILLTHMHGDHIGGLMKDGQRVFPNAQLYISEKEVGYWTNKELQASLPEGQQRGFAGAQAVVEAYQDHLHLFTPNEVEQMTELIPGVKSIASYGHTPGHTCYLVENGGKRFFIWGDLINFPTVQVPHPEIPTRHDIDPVQASITRAHVLKWLDQQGLTVAGMHVPYPGIGKLITTQRGLELELLK